MRLLFLFVLCLLLAGCSDPVSTAAGAAAVNIAAVPVFGRTLPDLAVSVVTRRDRSLVHVDQGKPDCTPQEPPPPKQPIAPAASASSIAGLIRLTSAAQRRHRWRTGRRVSHWSRNGTAPRAGRNC